MSDGAPIRRGMPVELSESKVRKPAKILGIFEFRCHLCRLTKSHPKLVELIHERHFKDRRPYSAIMEEVNGYIAAQRLDIKPIRHSSFTAHFNNHVPADTAFLHQVQADHSQRNEAAKQAQDDDVLSHVLAFKRENIQALQSNLARWQKIADQAYGRIDHVPTEGGEPPGPLLVKQAFGQFTAATQAITAITSTLDRYVNGKDFVVGVLREGIDHFTGKLALILGHEMASILEEAVEKKVGADDMGEWMHARLSSALARSINDLKAESQSVVVERYRLKGVG
jgi:hypothetical protein